VKDSEEKADTTLLKKGLLLSETKRPSSPSPRTGVTKSYRTRKLERKVEEIYICLQGYQGSYQKPWQVF